MEISREDVVKKAVDEIEKMVIVAIVDGCGCDDEFCALKAAADLVAEGKITPREAASLIVYTRLSLGIGIVINDIIQVADPELVDAIISAAGDLEQMAKGLSEPGKFSKKAFRFVLGDTLDKLKASVHK